MLSVPICWCQEDLWKRGIACQSKRSPGIRSPELSVSLPFHRSTLIGWRFFFVSQYSEPSLKPALGSLKTGRRLSWRFRLTTLLSEDMTISAIPCSVQFHPAVPASRRSATDGSEMEVKHMAILLDLWSIALVTHKQSLELKAQSSKPYLLSKEKGKEKKERKKKLGCCPETYPSWPQLQH